MKVNKLIYSIALFLLNNVNQTSERQAVTEILFNCLLPFHCSLKSIPVFYQQQTFTMFFVKIL